MLPTLERDLRTDWQTALQAALSKHFFDPSILRTNLNFSRANLASANTETRIHTITQILALKLGVGPYIPSCPTLYPLMENGHPSSHLSGSVFWILFFFIPPTASPNGCPRSSLWLDLVPILYVQYIERSTSQTAV